MTNYDYDIAVIGAGLSLKYKSAGLTQPTHAPSCTTKHGQLFHERIIYCALNERL